MQKFAGSCHCKNILLEADLSAAAHTYSPRACDCDFCRKHGAAYLSDPNGSLSITIKNPSSSLRYRQGSGTAEFILCRDCGVLAAVIYDHEGRLHGAVNVKTLDDAEKIGIEQSVSPKQLSAEEKTQRWRAVWFPKVVIR